MKLRYLIWILLVIMLGGSIIAQLDQNKPIYDPNDPIGRVLPPNVYFLVDVSGSMSWYPNNDRYYYDWGGIVDGTKINITKKAITSLMNRDSLRIRWSFWGYSGSSTGSYASDIDGTYRTFPSGLSGWTYVPHYGYQWYDTYVFSGSSCSSSVDRLFTPIFHAPSTDPEQWFKSSVDPGYDNRDDIKSWVDRDFNRTTGTVDVGWGYPFLKEIGAGGNTPISYSLQSILRYNEGQNLNGYNHYCYYFDLNQKRYMNWTPL